MNPVYKHGDFVLAFHWQNRQYRLGDVVLLRHPKFGMLIKRISQLREDHVLLEGDNADSSISPARIGWQPEDRILGKVSLNLSNVPKRIKQPQQQNRVTVADNKNVPIK